MELVLLILRLVSAFLLLGFLGLIAWLIYRDMRVTAAFISDQEGEQGCLRVIASESEIPSVGTSFPLRSVTSIGRASSNTIVLDDGYASNQHALLTKRGQQWWLEDLGSRNGLLLNELPLLESVVVSVGDVITIGNTKLRVEF